MTEPTKSSPPALPYPTLRLLLVIAAAGAGLLAVWTLIRFAAEIEVETYRSGLIGLFAALLAHIFGTLVGAWMAPLKGTLAAYLASTVVRFMLAPLLAVSLYFLLPAKPQPVLVGAAVGYLLILVADIGTMLTVMKSPQRERQNS